MNRAMNHRPPLDVLSFQKLLEAAWVLQCERDRKLSESHHGVTILAVPSGRDEWNAALPLTSPGSVFEPARAIPGAHTPPIYEIVAPSVAPSPLPVAPIYQRTEVSGALALAPNLHCSPLRGPIPFPPPDVFKKPARGSNETAVPLIRRREALSLVKERTLPTRTASNFKRASLVTAAYAGPVVALLIVLAFSFSLLRIHRPILTAVNATLLAPKIAVDNFGVDKDESAVDKDKSAVDASPTRAYVGQTPSPVAAASEHPRTDLPVLAPGLPEPTVLEPSHLRVTDTVARSRVAGLSPYEMQTVRQQARYGDAVAALTLGMAYEIGRYVPRSCTQAARWVAVAAKEGNSAAQYNLALRYISGDGTPTNLDKARKWLEKAAAHGYRKAQLTLEASRF
jgi:Sel1 repeat